MGASGVSLYKHRISMPVPDELRERLTPEAVALMPLDNLLADFTEEAAVGAQLLALKDDGRASRFVVIPGHPDANESSPMDEQNATSAAEALEIRIVLRELFFVGPSQHGRIDISESHDCVSMPFGARRAAKVCYRKRPCDAIPSQCCVVRAEPPACLLEVVWVGGS